MSPFDFLSPKSRSAAHKAAGLALGALSCAALYHGYSMHEKNSDPWERAPARIVAAKLLPDAAKRGTLSAYEPSYCLILELEYKNQEGNPARARLPVPEHQFACSPSAQKASLLYSSYKNKRNSVVYLRAKPQIAYIEGSKLPDIPPSGAGIVEMLFGTLAGTVALLLLLLS